MNDDISGLDKDTFRIKIARKIVDNEPPSVWRKFFQLVLR